MIEKVYITECGYCTNDLRKIYKGYKKQIVKFPANCVIIKHSKKGWILFDTGYAESIYKCGIIGKLYNMINPTYITDENNIKGKLEKINVRSEEISYIILSHFHPDHIGGLKLFEKSLFVTSEENYCEYKDKAFRPLIFKNLIPDDVEERILVLEEYANKIRIDKDFDGYDLFGDGEIVLIDLKGHSRGQIGMLLKNKNLFFVADSYWTKDELTEGIQLKLLPRRIQYNYSEYIKTRTWLRSLISENKSLRLISSHEVFNKMELSENVGQIFDIEILP